jgi:PAS domain S-box-containing protein
MIIRKHFLIPLILLCFAFASSQPYGSEKAVFSLTPEEKAWLAEHPEISVGIMDAWAPMNFVDETGTPNGIGVDYLKALNQRLGGVLTIQAGPFKKNYRRVKNKKLDALMDITPKKEREPFFNFTKPYLTIPHVIVSRKDGPYFDSEKDLAHKTIALERGFCNVTYFRKRYPDITIKEYGSTSEALDAVSRGEADAYAGNRAVVTYLVEKELLANLRVQGRMMQPPVVLTIGVRKDWPILAGILDRALAAITQEETRQIHRKWLEVFESAKAVIELTPKEQAWLARGHDVRVRVVDFPPFLIVNKGEEPTGISIDYLNQISDRTGIKFKYIFSTQPWKTAFEGFKNNQGPDLISSMMRTPERESFVSFSKVYLVTPRVIFTHAEGKFISQIEDLFGQTIAVPRGTVVQQEIEKKYPEISLLLLKSDEASLKAVSDGKADAYIGNLSLGYYLILQRGLTNLKVATPSPLSDHAFSFGIRKDWPELSRIIDKGLDTITPYEKLAIRNKYFSLRYEHGIRPADILKWILLVGGAASGILLWFVYWNRRLSKEVVERKQAEDAVRESRQQLSMILQTTAQGFWLADKDDYILEVNEATCETLGLAREEIVGMNFLEFLDEENKEIVREQNRIRKKGKQSMYEISLLRPDGTLVPCLTTLRPSWTRRGM